MSFKSTYIEVVFEWAALCIWEVTGSNLNLKTRRLVWCFVCSLPPSLSASHVLWLKLNCRFFP